jgi:hypothetical protein
LGERLLCKQEVIGSIPFTSTRPPPLAHLHSPTSTRADASDQRAPITRCSEKTRFGSGSGAAGRACPAPAAGVPGLVLIEG